MREIEYRVVDLTYGDHPIKKVTEIVFDEKGINQINVDYGCDILYPGKESILLQYTGIKDKHGKKIYEDDICAFKSGKCTYKGVVKWDDNLAGFGLQMTFGETDRLYTFSELNSMGIDLDTLEIVGSVHNGPRRFKEK